MKKDAMGAERSDFVPTVSIVMPLYNRANLLARAIQSVIQQTVEDWELIVVDDGSTDNFLAVIERFADPRIRVVHHGRNRGIAAAKNTGFDSIRGRWFTSFDSDDEMMPEALEVMLACAERTGATAITCNAIDTSHGGFSGRGPTQDGWLTPEQTARTLGDFWGLTKTSLLGDLRFDERLVTDGIPSVWTGINRRARRYYLHRPLLIIHTEGADRLCARSHANSVRYKVRWFCIAGQDERYLRELKRVNPSSYRRLRRKIFIARILRPLLRVSLSVPVSK